MAALLASLPAAAEAVDTLDRVQLLLTHGAPLYFGTTPLLFTRSRNFLSTLRFVLPMLTIVGAQYRNVLTAPLSLRGSVSHRLRLASSALTHLLSLVLFVWAAHTTRRDKLTYIMADDLPNKLYREGPFAYVRHPNYTSYILSFIAMALSTERWATGLLRAAVVAAMFAHAARQEERKFEKSRLAVEYARYRKVTGMFFPRLAV